MKTPTGQHESYLEIEQETDGRWIAEAIDVPGALTYGITASDAIDRVTALRKLILEDRQRNDDSDPRNTRDLN